MKKLFITLLLLLFTFSTLTAQEEFNGMWESEDSSYLTTIIATKYKILSVFNTSFEEYRVITEDIVSQEGNKFTTELNNDRNGYSVTVEYTLKDKETLILKYAKDLEGEYILTRLY
jgi:hypothetical protein|tara:strand:- start:170 stop:517 length:348 start_codon:yes stop_codon:yes gene_type:complete